MNIFRGSSSTLARAIRKAGPFLRLRRGLKRFTSPIWKWDNRAAPVPDWNSDVLLAYPDTCNNAPASYPKLVEFYRANKYEQWQVLKEYFKCPEFKDPPFVQRPLRHEGGEGFTVVNDRPTADHDNQFYWRSLWERNSEYRVFFVRGEKVLTLLKRVAPSTPQNIPWNAGVSSFVTVNDPNHDRLRHSKFYEKTTAFFRDYPFVLCAVDVLYRQHKHRVVEVNFSPGVLIEDNLRLLTTKLLHGRCTPSNTRSN